MKITANQITFARIFLLPIPCALLLYGGIKAWWVAFFLYTALGITDTIDGILARKYGATRLGGLIDPVADKIFMASILIAFTGLGYFPWWGLALIFCRELLVTALRSSVAIRHGQVKLTTLAKLKTIIQMGGMGTFFWTMALPVPWLIGVSSFAGFCFLAPWVYLRLRGHKQPPFYLLPVGFAFVGVAMLGGLVEKETSLLIQALAIVGITLASAIEYLAASWRVFKKDGLTSFDITRIFWAVAYGFFALPVVGIYPEVFLPLLIGLSFELALGGLENVVTSEGGRLHNGWYLMTGTLATLFGVSSFLVAFAGIPMVFPLLAWVLAFGSALSFGVNFYRWRHLFAHAL